jgi:TrpR-related protein YerC/YecD
MRNSINNQKTDSLLNAVLALKNKQEARKFFRDLLTEAEIEEFGNRWEAAQMLNQGVSYNQIVKSTGLSSTTVARISSWLKKGTGGYRLMLKRIGHQHNSSSSGKGLR